VVRRIGAEYHEEAIVRRTVRLALVTGFLMSLLAGPAQAGPCGALGDVCQEVLYRPMDQLCRIYDVCV
jgi:hypothetical protein